MLTVHHLSIAQSDRIVWLCEELAIPYDLVRHERDKSGMAPAALKALHPVGKAPIIVDGDLVLAESGAIVEYILQRYGRGRLTPAPDSADWTAYLFWLHYANASFLPALTLDIIRGAPGVTMGLLGERYVAPRVRDGYDLVERRLGEAPYFAGEDLSGADIMMLFPLTTLRHLAPRDFAPYPNIRAYLGRIGERPAFQRTMRATEPDRAPLLS